MKYFTAKNLQELRKEYKKLMVANHPDNGGDVVTCQEITAEYKKLFDMFKAGQTPEEEKKNTFDYKADEALRNVINNIADKELVERIAADDMVRGIHLITRQTKP